MKMGEKDIQQGVQQGLQRVGEGVGHRRLLQRLRFSLPFFAHLEIDEADFASRPRSPNDKDVVVPGSGRWWGVGQRVGRMWDGFGLKFEELNRIESEGFSVRSGLLDEEVLRS